MTVIDAEISTPPVAIEREAGQRAEDVEVRFDAAAGDVDQQGANQHLADADDVARGERAAAEPDHQDRRGGDGRTEAAARR